MLSYTRGTPKQSRERLHKVQGQIGYSPDSQLLEFVLLLANKKLRSDNIKRLETTEESDTALSAVRQRYNITIAQPGDATMDATISSSVPNLEELGKRLLRRLQSTPLLEAKCRFHKADLASLVSSLLLFCAHS